MPYQGVAFLPEGPTRVYYWYSDDTYHLEPEPMKTEDKIEMETHKTGAVRGTDLKATKYFLMSPTAIRRYAEVMAEGAGKYGLYNWEKGFPISDLIDHTLAHIFSYLAGDRSEDHLGHALWNVCAAVHSEEHWPHLNTDLRPAINVPDNQVPGIVDTLVQIHDSNTLPKFEITNVTEEEFSDFLQAVVTEVSIHEAVICSAESQYVVGNIDPDYSRSTEAMAAPKEAPAFKQGIPFVVPFSGEDEYGPYYTRENVPPGDYFVSNPYSKILRRIASDLNVYYLDSDTGRVDLSPTAKNVRTSGFYSMEHFYPIDLCKAPKPPYLLTNSLEESKV